ncbi:MAG: Jag N-terminal domain-containing protein [Deltaproteobacteria bacterium]|nr:Jag N-terminal domain-containing protein [Deltaproteobacteria bacterium]
MSDRDQFEGKTLSDAIERASMKFNATRDRIEYRVVKESQGGFFGLLGGKIVIEAWVRETSSDADLESKYAVPAGEPQTRTGAEAPRGGRDAEPRAEQAPGEHHRRRRGRRGRSKGGPREKDPAAGTPQGAGRERHGRDQRPVASEPAIVGPEVEAFLKGLFVHLGETPQTALDEDEQQLLVRLTVAQDSIFSSREGHTIESLKFILDKVVNKGPMIRKRVKVHVSEVVSADQAEWTRLGTELGRKALSIGKPISVRGLAPADRKVIHTAVMNVPGVETVSAGDGSFRRLFIVPKGARPPAPPRPAPSEEDAQPATGGKRPTTDDS